MYACVYVCMYVCQLQGTHCGDVDGESLYVCMCMYICMYVCKLQGAHFDDVDNTFWYVCRNMCTCIYVCIPDCRHVCHRNKTTLQLHTYKYACTRTHNMMAPHWRYMLPRNICIHTYIQIYIHTYIYTYTHTHTT
jgi:hypothetical protein